ncbi:MAG: DUF3048 domain-containing protein, partial [Acidimicrobiaceae bacterium]|nr:DUF3048 domain-containing protein [Acidimicrobiaceae bacterium]
TTASTTTVPTTTTTLPATTTTVPRPPRAPLTGLPARSSAAVNRAAVVVKIDNVDDARPQTGINQADVVYEEMVEGGLSRLAAVFQSQLPDPVGPVRSGRTTDEGIIDDLNEPVFAYSGANADFLAALYLQPVHNVNADNHPDLFFRGGTHLAPHNLFANATQLVTLAGASKGRPPVLFDYRSPRQRSPGSGATPTASATLAFPSASAVWTWYAKTDSWLRDQDGTPDVDTAGVQVSAANVVIQAIPYSSPLIEANGTPIPEGEMVGSGQAWILTAGQMLPATWNRADLTSTTTYTDSAGKSVLLTPGKTWVELLPTGTTPSFRP